MCRMVTFLVPSIVSVSILAVSRSLASDGETEKTTRVTVTKFGEMPDGERVDLYTLRNSNGVSASVMTLGATLTTVRTPDRHGKLDIVTLHRESFEGYRRGHPLLGSIVGRFANRVAGARFSIEGDVYELEANAGKHHIHGGGRDSAFHWQVWKASPTRQSEGVGVRLSLRSPDGQAGFPGDLDVIVEYMLNDRNELSIEYEAKTTRATHVNLTNHAYWNLAGAAAGRFDDHVLELRASHFLPAGADRIPTGEIRAVVGTAMDFREPLPIGARLDRVERGHYDHCYVLKKQDDDRLVLAARVTHPATGRTLEVLTTQPGVQLYTGNKKGFCLETQHFPNSPNEPRFPSTLLRPGEAFRQKTVHRFGTVGKKGE